MNVLMNRRAVLGAAAAVPLTLPLAGALRAAPMTIPTVDRLSLTILADGTTIFNRSVARSRNSNWPV